MANVITNGNFESGSSGFNDEAYSNSLVQGVFDAYSASITSTPPPRAWSLGTDPSSVYSGWPSFGDHTSGSGNMFLAMPENTGSLGRIFIHFTSIPVEPNTDYVVTFYIRILDDVGPFTALLNTSLVEENASYTVLDNKTYYESFDYDNGWVQFERTLNTGDETEVRLQIFPYTSRAWALDDVVMTAYSAAEDDSSSSSSAVDNSVEIVVPEKPNITYFSYFNGPKDISNPIINNSTGMRFGGYLDKTNDSVLYDSFGYGVDKTIWNYGTIWCDDASKLFSLDRGYVKMVLNFDEDIVGGHTGLTGTPDHNEYLLWGVNVSQSGVESGGIGAKLTSGSLDFEIKTNRADLTLTYYGLEVDAGSDVTLEFVWEAGGMLNGYTAALVVNGVIQDFSEYQFSDGTNGDAFVSVPFYCLNTPLGHNNMACTIKHLQTGDGITREFKEILETSSSSSSSSTEGDGPAIGTNQPVVIFGFIDESSPYLDSTIRQTDANEFDDYIADNPPLSGSKFVCFACTPCTAGASCNSLFPGPSNVTEDTMVKNALGEWTKMKTYFDQAVSDMGLNTESQIYLFFSIDNSGSMTDSDVRGAINQMIAYTNWTYPNCIVDDTFGSKQERWISDMLYAYQTLGV